MSDADFDFVVIGGGSAGYAGAGTACRLGLRVAVIEGGPEVGGLCILRGCMPSKTLLESATRAETIRRAEEFGLRAEWKGAVGPEIAARKRRLIADFAGYRKEQLETGNWEFIRGNARFVDPNTVEVALQNGGSQRITGRSFLIATGSEMNWVDVPGLKETGAWTSDEVLVAETIPKSVVVLGGGAIALELASYYAGVGSEVTVIQRSHRLLKEVDADVADSLAEGLRKHGIVVHTGTALASVEKTAAGKAVHFFKEGERMTAEGEEIIYALGRKPNVAHLCLENAGVLTGKGAVVAGLSMQSTVPHIFAAGDVCGPYEVVHIAIQQAEIAARNAARLLQGGDEKLEHIDYTLKLFAVFTHPEVAAVGLTEREAADLGIAFIEAKYPFDDHGKSMVKGETHGFVKLIVASETRKIIGAAVIGPDASEIIHEVVVAMQFNATAADLAKVPHYHPTLSEIWTYPAEALAEV
ncbi:MAG: dihydrolipoyl dehydrogenase family protein [Chthoniobacteraceae bacterium]